MEFANVSNYYLNPHGIPLIIVGLLILWIGVFVLRRRGFDAVGVSFFVMCLSGCIWLTPTGFGYLSRTESIAAIWFKVDNVGVVFLSSTVYFFVASFLGINKKRVVAIAFANIASACFAISIFATGLWTLQIQKFYWGYFPKWGALAHLFLPFFFSYMLASFVELYFAYRHTSSVNKNQIRYLFIAFVMAYTSSSNYFATFGIQIYPTGYLSMLFFFLITAYAITKTRLMDLSVVISRALAELLTFSFFGVIYLAIVWFYRNYASNSIDVPFIIISLFCGALVGRMHNDVRIFLQTTSDKLFIRGKYDYYRELSDASSHVGETLALPTILKVLYETFYNVVEISNPRVFLPENFTHAENASNDYVVFSKETFAPEKDVPEGKQGGLRIKADDKLVDELIKKRVPIFDGKELDAHLIVPCLLENRLIAMFVLGKKMSEDPYTDEDIRLLTILANQVAVALDHTRSYEKIKADLESAEHALERSQRLASIGTLVAGVTHEIRNPMTVIRGRVETLFNAERDEAYKKDAQRAILENADRIERIIQAMLGLARDKEHRSVVDVNINDVLEKTIEFFPFNSTKLHKELGAVPTFKGDVDGLREVFVNLMQNAIEAMGHGGDLTIKTYTEEGHAVVEIADTGKGIPPEIREKIFDPFFSSRHEGVGLGLSIAYRIVREHGGDMKFTSEVGKGTTFKITF